MNVSRFPLFFITVFSHFSYQLADQSIIHLPSSLISRVHQQSRMRRRMRRKRNTLHNGCRIYSTFMDVLHPIPLKTRRTTIQWQREVFVGVTPNDYIWPQNTRRKTKREWNPLERLIVNLIFLYILFVGCMSRRRFGVGACFRRVTILFILGREVSWWRFYIVEGGASATQLLSPGIVIFLSISRKDYLL